VIWHGTSAQNSYLKIVQKSIIVSLYFQKVNMNSPIKKNPSKKKRLSVERIYQKKTQLEHILLRPDTYIGSVEPNKQTMWVYDDILDAIVSKEITYVPGLYKIFDEILGKNSNLRYYLSYIVILHYVQDNNYVFSLQTI